MKQKISIAIISGILMLVSCKNQQVNSHSTEEKEAVKKPNFLVILTDDQRMDALTCYNADLPIKTPNIDKIAQNVFPTTVFT